MSSRALCEMKAGLAEVDLLRRHVPHTSAHTSSSRDGTNSVRIANRRACTVLLCSHFERFIYGLNDEAVDFLNSVGLSSEEVPEKLRLLQAKAPIDDLALQSWDRRGDKLRQFACRHSQMWLEGAPVTQLDSASNLVWMKSPKVGSVCRYFRMFGIDDIFREVTRSESVYRDLKRSIQSLVDSRNGIAHGDSTVQPNAPQVTEFRNAVDNFGCRADRVFSRQLKRLSRSAAPW